MSSGFDDFSLALFTTLAPAGTVAVIVLALTRVFAKSPETAVSLDRMIALPFSVCLVGFIASATHLGTPANALHVFAGIGRSPLSNEVFSAVIFLFLVGSYWMMAFKRNFPNALARAWLVCSCVAGIAFLVCTSTAYAVHTVPTWDTWYTPANLLLGGLMAGLLLGLLFLGFTASSSRISKIVLVASSGTAFAARCILLLGHFENISTLANNETVATSLVPHYPAVIMIHIVLGAVAIFCAACSLGKTRNTLTTHTLQALAVILSLAAVCLSRVVFYQLHLTLGF